MTDWRFFNCVKCKCPTHQRKNLRPSKDLCISCFESEIISIRMTEDQINNMHPSVPWRRGY